MIMLKDYVDWGLTHSDKTANAEGVPLILENCVNNKKLKQLEVYGADGGVGDECVRNWVDKSLFLHVEDYNAATNYSFYKAKYIENLKPNTKYNVVVERLNGTNPISAKCTVLLSGGVFLPTSGNYTTIGHASSNVETNSSPHISDENGRMTIGISTSTTQKQLDSLWANTNIYLYEEGDTKIVYRLLLVINSKTVQTLYLDEPLDYADVLSFGEKKVKRHDGTYEDADCQLPVLTSKTSLIEIDTAISPSNIKCKYIKK